MRCFAASFISALVLAIMATGQTGDAKPAWNVTLPIATKAPSTITVQNRCQKSHSFKLEKQAVPFLEIGQNEVQVGGGVDQVVAVMFNTNGLEPKVYQGRVVVVCLTCGSEPTCTQDREILPVVLNVTGNTKPAPPAVNNGQNIPANFKQRDPCELIEDRCDDLKDKAHRLEAQAAGSQDAADAARVPADAAAKTADDAETAAKDSEDAAKDAADAAKDDPSDYEAKVDDQEYSSADVAYRLVLQTEINRAQKAGEISVAEHKQQTEANTTKKARDERLKNLEELGEEAEAAKKAADEARKAADEAKKAAEAAKTAADAAQSAADAAKKEAGAARKAYDDCIDKINEECRKLKAEEARIQAEIQKAADAKAAKLKAEKDKEERDAARAVALIEKDKYLVDNIQRLGLIDSRLVRKDAASIYQWLPTWLQTPAALLVESASQTPIPVDVLQAFARMYGLASSLLDPCTAGGKLNTITKLNGMVNPNTGLNYTDSDAIKKMADMCDLFARIRAKLETIKKAQQMRK